MTTIVTRAGKGSPLTNNEVDANFTNLNDAKIETLTSTDTSVTITGTGASRNLSVPVNPNVVSGPASATDNAVARFDTTTGKLVQNSVVTIDDTGNEAGVLSQQFSNGSAVTLAAGKQWYDGSTGSWNLGMGGGNITQQVGEELYYYGKASAAITDSPLQLIYKTGTVGASGIITFAPTVAGITDGDLILGVATENIALNAFGRITTFGVVHGITTNGAAYGETWADGDVIWYNPVTGNPTKVKPVAPNLKVQIGTILNAGSGGSGSIQVEINHGSVLGGTDSNVQITSADNGNILTYDGGNGYFKNTDLTAGTAISVSKSANGVLTVNNTGVTSVTASTGISVSSATGGVTITNSAPDQTVALTAGAGISVSGTYPNFTVTSTVTGASITDDTTTAATYYPLVSTSTTGSLSAVKVSSTKYTFNPSTGALSATSFNGSGSGLTALGTSTSYQVGSFGVGTAASGTAGEIRATNNITAYYSSDRQFKENIETIPNALSSVEAIGGKLFDWTDAYLEAHGGADDYFIHKADFGVIAQDVKAVFPRAVRTRPDGSLAVDYEKLVALAFAAIVELSAEVKALKEKG